MKFSHYCIVCPTAPTRLRVNIAAVAAANTVHWVVLQNLLRKPETQAHLEKRMYVNSVLLLQGNTFTVKRHLANTQWHTHLPEHGCDHLPGEREDTNPDTGDSDSLQNLVKLVVCESCKNKKKMWTKHWKTPLLLFTCTCTHANPPILEETAFCFVSSCRSKHTIAPKIMRDQTASSSREHSHDHSLESDQSKERQCDDTLESSFRAERTNNSGPNSSFNVCPCVSTIQMCCQFKDGKLTNHRWVLNKLTYTDDKNIAHEITLSKVIYSSNPKLESLFSTLACTCMQLLCLSYRCCWSCLPCEARSAHAGRPEVTGRGSKSAGWRNCSCRSKW